MLRFLIHFPAGFLDFVGERGILKYIQRGTDKPMANFNPDKKRILLVEDHEDSREIVALVLEKYNLTYAHNFDEGARMARRGYFDLYILDNWLPGGSGSELCRIIREFDPHTPILFYSAVAYAKKIEEGLRAGAQAYLVKPVSFDDLEQTVAKLTCLAGGRGPKAWRAEIDAIRDELAIQQTKITEHAKRSTARHLRALEKLMRLKAGKAFLDAGGTRGEFARRWPSVLKEV
jgi:DNA-binding response OmpR family regulator